MKQILLLYSALFCGILVHGQYQQLSFNDADNDKVTIPANAAYELGADSFTIEAVINASEDQSNTFPMIVSKRGSDEFSGFFLALNRVNTEYYLFVQIDGLNYFAGQTQAVALNDGQCHHVAAKRDGNTISIFVDGVMINSASVSSTRTIDNDADIFIGEDEARNSDTSFNGIIGEVRFWDIARDDTDIEDNALQTLSDTNESGLVGYWRLNEIGEEQTVADFSTTANNGVLGDTNTIDNNDPDRIDGNCIEIPVSNNQLVFTDADKDRITIPANAAYELGADSFTIEAVINASEDQSNTFPMIVSKRGSDEFSGFFLALNRVNTEYYLFVQIDGLNYFAGQTQAVALNDGQCHHVAAKRDGDTISIFVDGVMINSASVSSTRTIDNDADIFIGEDEARNSDTSFNGIIGEVRFWDIGRDDTDIEDNALQTLSDTKESGLVGYWRLNGPIEEQTVADFSSTANNGVLGNTDAIEAIDPERIEGNCVGSDVLSITDFETTLDIVVYPNPFTDQITVDGDIIEGSYTLFSITGRLVIKGSIKRGEAIIVPAELASGTYFMNVKDLKGKENVLKLIKL